MERQANQRVESPELGVVGNDAPDRTIEANPRRRSRQFDPFERVSVVRVMEDQVVAIVRNDVVERSSNLAVGDTSNDLSRSRLPGHDESVTNVQWNSDLVGGPKADAVDPKWLAQQSDGRVAR
jgi:hypothetical protein